MREKERSTRVVFVRHGQTDFPADRIYCDDLEDPPLNGSGCLQAAQAANCLDGVKLAALYASPSLRTRMTAETLAASHIGLPVVYGDSLRERHFGIWEGRYFNEIERDFAVEYRDWKRDQAVFKPLNGESIYDLADRAVSFVRNAVERHIGETVAIVTHVGPIRVLVSEALGLPVESYRQLCIDPASITVVDYGASQNNLILMNFHGRHWPKDQVTG